jgi:23S rRNA pseudouridine2605 synthase
MARRNESGSSSGRRGSSRTNSGGRSFSGKRKSSDKPFRKSDSPDSGKSSSYGKGERKSFAKRDDQSENRPFRKRSATSGRDEGPFSGKRKSSGRPFRKSDSSDSRGSSSFEKRERKSFGKKDDQSESRPFRKRTSTSEGGSFASRKRSAGPYQEKPGQKRPFKKSENFNKGTEGQSSGEKRNRRGDSNFKKGPSFGLPYKRSYDKKRGGAEGRSSDSKQDSVRGTSKERFKKYSDNDAGKSSYRKREDNDSRPGNTSGNRFSKSTGKNYSRPERGGKSARGKRDSDEESGFFKKAKARNEKGRVDNPLQGEANAPAQTTKIRLNKYIANSGVCSRREADELITMGLVSVNGKTVTEMGFKVNPGDEVRYENKVLKAEKPVYILMNKPKGYLTTTDDPQERNTVMHIIGGAVKERIYPVGRLDRNTTGLLLLTNDGDLADKLMHPSYNAKKIYKVELDRPLTKADLQTITEGVMLEEGRATVDDVAIISEDGKTVGVEIHIGWNRVIRRIFENFGYEVTRLDRSVYAGLDKKNLGRGEWRFLTKEEIVRLKHYN